MQSQGDLRRKKKAMLTSKQNTTLLDLKMKGESMHQEMQRWNARQGTDSLLEGVRPY